MTCGHSSQRRLERHNYHAFRQAGFKIPRPCARIYPSDPSTLVAYAKTEQEISWKKKAITMQSVDCIIRYRLGTCLSNIVAFGIRCGGSGTITGQGPGVQQLNHLHDRGASGTTEAL